MKTIGVDLHKCSLTAMVIDEQGKILERKDIPTNSGIRRESRRRKRIHEYFGSCGASCRWW